MSEPKTTTINVSNVPVGPMEFLSPHAIGEGYAGGYSGVVRFALVKHATLLGWKPGDDNETPTEAENANEETDKAGGYSPPLS